MDYRKRLAEAREYMKKLDLDGLFLAPGGDAEYLLGVSKGRANPTHHHLKGDWLYGFFITASEAVYMVPEMLSSFLVSAVEGNNLLTGVHVMNPSLSLEDHARNIIGRLGLENGTLAVSKGVLSKTLVYFRRFFPKMSFRSSEEFTCRMRMIKDADEIALMRAASELTDRIFEDLVPALKIGMSEIDIECEIDYQMKKRGASGNSFPSAAMIQGGGVLCGLGGGSDRTLAPGQTLAFDFGMVLNGYCSDFGRTLYVGEMTGEQERIHRLLHESQKEGLDALTGSMKGAGPITAEGLNGIVHGFLDDHGLGEKFFHRLGHNIGLDVHEYPYLDRGYTEILRPGMTFTVEPSVYMPGENLIRVEDVILLTDHGSESLNKASREPLVIQ